MAADGEKNSRKIGRLPEVPISHIEQKMKHGPLYKWRWNVAIVTLRTVLSIMQDKYVIVSSHCSFMNTAKLRYDANTLITKISLQRIASRSQEQIFSYLFTNFSITYFQRYKNDWSFDMHYNEAQLYLK